MDPRALATEFGCFSVCPSKSEKLLVTYKRRKCDTSSHRDTSGLPSAANIEGNQDEVSSEADLPSTSSLKLLTPEKLDTINSLFKCSSPLVKRVPDSKRTIAPGPSRRVCGQYFLDLGQADFTHTTCLSCGLVYARGQESDEKLHTVFHRSQLKGIHFKGWRHERVALTVSSKGDRVIHVLPGDPHSHLKKVREVVKVMEQELGLSPGWLWQRHCKVYLFISASKKILGCIVAEPITCAFPIVPFIQEDIILQQPSAAELQPRTSTTSNSCKDPEDIPSTERFYNMSINPRAIHPDASLYNNPEPVATTSSVRKNVITDIVPTSVPDLVKTDLKVDPTPTSQPNGVDGVQDEIATCSAGSPSIVHMSKERPKPSTRLIFGDWKFTREVVSRKKQCSSDQGDLGRAILCSKTGVPAVCGVRGMWVSRSERRKGVATHLLDAMRKTFCLGLTLRPSQCAFSQPTPDGQAFAARYCGTPAFLVYQNLRYGRPRSDPLPRTQRAM